MSAPYPRIRLDGSFEGQRLALLRECVTLAFYMRRSHGEVHAGILHALETYLHAVGPRALGWYVDTEGEWKELDEAGHASVRQRLIHPRGATLELAGAPDDLTGYGLTYRGRPLDVSSSPDARDEVCMVTFSLPTEHLERVGAEAVRALALKLGEGLPFDSGHMGLALQFPGWTHDNTPLLRDSGLRYPGLDIPERSLALHLGTRVKGAHWLTFLGQPVLGPLGGVGGLRARLRSPDTTVEALGEGRAVISLGPRPEAGDRERGLLLPAYRELARLLEPWLYTEQRCPWGNLSPEELRRWERRFLD